MTSNTDTLGSDTGGVDREIATPRRPHRSRGRRALRWAAVAGAAVVTAALALGALTGDDDRTAVAAHRAAWQHEEQRYVESLESRAASLPDASRTAFAREAERYVEWLESRAASIAGDRSFTDGFVPGSQHVPVQ